MLSYPNFILHSFKTKTNEISTNEDLIKELFNKYKNVLSKYLCNRPTDTVMQSGQGSYIAFSFGCWVSSFVEVDLRFG